MLLVMPQAMAYTIDGDLSDWGVDLTGDWSSNDTWVPNPGVRFVVEDNYDSDLAPYSSYIGVHITGVSPTYSYYDEPYQEPMGEELYDIEAMYVDENSTHIFVALVVSMESWAIGDLALNLDANSSTGGYGYEYGVKLNTQYGGILYGIYSTPSNDCWTQPIRHPNIKSPSKVDINNATYTGVNAIGAWRDTGITDYGRTNWVIELAIPKTAVGMAVGQSLYDAPLPKVIWMSEPCGNETINIPIPEFMVLLIPVGLLLGVIFLKARSKT